MKSNYLFLILILLSAADGWAQVSTAVNQSCKDDANGLVKIVYDASLNCSSESGTLEGSTELGFQSGTDNFGGSTVTWDAPTAITAKNAGCDTFEVLLNVEEYYGVSYGSISNIAFVFNQGPEFPADPWSLVGRDTVPGVFGCSDLLVTMADLPSCPLFCEPDTVTYPGFGLWPDTLSGFSAGSACDCEYIQPLTINVREDTLIEVPGLGPVLFEIIHFRLDSVSGFPPGFFIECEADNFRKPSASQPLSCIVDQLTNNCAAIKGNPQAAGPGIYPVTLYTTGRLYHPITDTIEAVDSFDQYIIVIDTCESSCSSEDAPTGLGHSLDGTGLTLYWDPVPNSVACQVRGGVSGGGTSSRIVNGTAPSSFFIPLSRLTPLTDYEWSVRCACDKDPLDATPYAPTATVSLPLLRTSEHQTLIIQPNPADRVLTVRFEAIQQGPLQLLDLTGRVLSQISVPEESSAVHIDISHLPDGIYIVRGAEDTQASAMFTVAR